MVALPRGGSEAAMMSGSGPASRTRTVWLDPSVNLSAKASPAVPPFETMLGMVFRIWDSELVTYLQQ